MARDSLSDCTASREPEVVKKHWGRLEIVRGVTVLFLLFFISGCYFELPRNRFQDIVVFGVLCCNGLCVCVCAYFKNIAKTKTVTFGRTRVSEKVGCSQNILTNNDFRSY